MPAGNQKTDGGGQPAVGSRSGEWFARRTDSTDRRLSPVANKGHSMSGDYLAAEASREAAVVRRQAVQIADLFGMAAANLWRYRWAGGTYSERRRVAVVTGALLQAIDLYLVAGLGRQAAVCGRLIRLIGQRYHADY